MASLFRWARASVRRTPFSPLRFPTTGFEVVPDSVFLEEEQFEEFKAGLYYPMKPGEILASRYQIIGKLGFGRTSTVWLANDMRDHQHVTVKAYTREMNMLDEFKTYQKLSQANRSHRGFPFVRTALDTLKIPRVGGDHDCLIQQPMWGSLLDLLDGDTVNNGLPEKVLKTVLKSVLSALDYLHTECNLIHTDITCDNILIDIEDTSVFEAFTKAELERPSRRKVVDGTAIYASRPFNRPQAFGKPVLGDFGSAVSGVEVQRHAAQPVIYKAPEMMLRAGWTYPIDIWNLAALIWDMFEGRHLFYGNDPDGKGYSTKAHLAEVIALLGLPPADLLERGERSHEFFDKDGAWIADIEIAKDQSLEKCDYILEGENQEMFLNFVRGMLTWRPEDRKIARELLRDPWLNSA